MKMQKYAAELLGTFALTLAVGLSLVSSFPLATPLVAGLTLGIFVYTVGGISGAHLNPAVTIGLASVKKIEIKDAVIYVLSQIIGALLAMLVMQALTGSGGTGLVAGEGVKLGVVEAIGAFILVFGVSAVVFGKVDDDASGIVIGSSLTLGIMMTAGLSNGVLNPAVAVGIGSISFMYILAPIVGGVVAAWVFKFLSAK